MWRSVTATVACYFTRLSMGYYKLVVYIGLMNMISTMGAISLWCSYFDALDRIHADDYIPTIDDVLRVRVPTTGIHEYNFQMRKDVVFR